MPSPTPGRPVPTVHSRGPEDAWESRAVGGRDDIECSAQDLAGRAVITGGRRSTRNSPGSRRRTMPRSRAPPPTRRRSPPRRPAPWPRDRPDRWVPDASATRGRPSAPSALFTSWNRSARRANSGRAAPLGIRGSHPRRRNVIPAAVSFDPVGGADVGEVRSSNREARVDSAHDRADITGTWSVPDGDALEHRAPDPWRVRERFAAQESSLAHGRSGTSSAPDRRPDRYAAAGGLLPRPSRRHQPGQIAVLRSRRGGEAGGTGSTGRCDRPCGRASGSPFHTGRARRRTVAAGFANRQGPPQKGWEPRGETRPRHHLGERHGSRAAIAHPADLGARRGAPSRPLSAGVAPRRSRGSGCPAGVGP